MHTVLIIAGDATKGRELYAGLTGMGFACLDSASAEDVIKDVAQQTFDVVLLDMDGSPALAWTESTREWLQEIKLKRQLSVIALISGEMLDEIDSYPEIDDFVVKPGGIAELATRVRRAYRRAHVVDSEELVRCGDLVIDLARCEVSVRGRVLTLTFREYELLKFLASSRGRVFTRDALLDKVWGYDYYGGDRTVDVHIRRLRSKIEDSSHTFIETVRNIGYRFREEA